MQGTTKSQKLGRTTGFDRFSRLPVINYDLLYISSLQNYQTFLIRKKLQEASCWRKARNCAEAALQTLKGQGLETIC